VPLRTFPSALFFDNASQGQSHATEKHGSLVVVTTNRAWHDCAFLPFFVIAVLTVVAGQTLDLNTNVCMQFLKAFKRNDKGMAVGCLKFIAHLCNQQVAHEALALEIMVLLLETPTNDSVEIALEFARPAGSLRSGLDVMLITCICKLAAAKHYRLQIALIIYVVEGSNDSF